MQRKRRLDGDHEDSTQPVPGQHLNETWNNLANVYYRRGSVQEAKGAWEKALTYAPHDELTRRNLRQFIYDNDALPRAMRTPSPFVARLL